MTQTGGIGVVLVCFGCATTGGSGPTLEAAMPEPSPADVAALRADLAEMFVERGALDAALPLVAEALRLAPRSPRPHTLLAVVLRDRGVREQAERELKVALELEPGYAPALTALGVLYDQEHRFVEAAQAH